MFLDLKSRIYKAQTIGNVEPIEHMIPYPNLRSLIDGQNIKYCLLYTSDAADDA